MARIIQIMSVSVFGLILGACEVGTEGNSNVEGNEQALSGDDGSEDGRRGRGRRGPPPEATQACSGLEEGASCSFDGFRGNVEGTCTNHPRVDGLTCMPEGRFGKGRGRGHRGPPAQATQACSELEEGASCSFDCSRCGNVEGTCQSHPRRDGLTCLSEEGRGRGHRFGR